MSQAHSPSPAIKATCSSCSMHQLCLPIGMESNDMQKLEKIVGRQRIAKGQTLYESGKPFDTLYAIRFGHFKTFRINHFGAQQINGFQMAGDLMGLDAIASNHYISNALALEDSEVCAIPYAQLEPLLSQIPTLQRQFLRTLSKEISRDQQVMMLLNSMKAPERLASFLLGLSESYARRGYAANQFQLRMTREDIGNYLGLAVESVSRQLGDFKKTGLLQVNHRNLQILDTKHLQQLASGNQFPLQ